MGYTTYFKGKFTVDRPVDPDTARLLYGLAHTRRMKRNRSSEYGIEGEFYVDGPGFLGQDRETDIVDYNQPPRSQPSLWCQWYLLNDSQTIEWNGGEKFYNYNEWISYLANAVLKPRGYKLNGLITWFGEDLDDRGMTYLKNNIRFTLNFDILYLLNKLGIKDGSNIYK